MTVFQLDLPVRNPFRKFELIIGHTNILGSNFFLLSRFLRHKMLSIRRSNVPEYSKNGHFLAGLDPEDEEAFEVPSHCFKPNSKVDSLSDLVLLLKSLRFWGVETLPFTVIKFIVEKHRDNKWPSGMCAIHARTGL